MDFCQLLNLLHKLRNPESPGALFHARQIGTASAEFGALSDPQIQFPKRPVILSHKIVIVLTEYCVNFRSVYTRTALTAVAGKRLIPFLKC